MKKTKPSLKTQLSKLDVGDIIEVTWVDISVESTLDGSARDLVNDYKDISYVTVGYYLGVNKKSRVLVLANDRRDDKDDEYRGTLNIPLAVIREIGVL